MELFKVTLSPVEPTLYTRNSSLDKAGGSTEPSIETLSMSTYIYIPMLICLLGIGGNGLMIIFLTFYIKRKPFTVYILHLATADFMVLLSTIILQLINFSSEDLQKYIIYMEIFGYNTGLHLLTAISVERCLSVLYPIWYQCRRPKHQSAVSCTVLWAHSFLVSGLENFFCVFQLEPQLPECRDVYIFSCVLTFVFVCLMVFSNLILFVKVGCNRKPRQPAKLYVIVTATVVLFLVFAIPLKVLLIVAYYSSDESVWDFFPYLNMLSTINCSVNPIVYFVVGSIRRRKGRKSLKEVLQRVFEEKPMLT
ncbi:mas-related G-protein coupled receptor member H-like [Echinops telfairi]|uniref:Mas-related G-protein coupled receptor member H-like n=1 Tax=Echinops telfairi TaxID=9371 RepID=A0ABM0IKM2_ECHTE|nr:mas-related G-protein coupled receptor member H-like [Echinops telfairi]